MREYRERSREIYVVAVDWMMEHNGIETLKIIELYRAYTNEEKGKWTKFLALARLRE